MSIPIERRHEFDINSVLANFGNYFEAIEDEDDSEIEYEKGLIIENLNRYIELHQEILNDGYYEDDLGSRISKSINKEGQPFLLITKIYYSSVDRIESFLIPITEDEGKIIDIGDIQILEG